jgi:hypothetical protein
MKTDQITTDIGEIPRRCVWTLIGFALLGLGLASPALGNGPPLAPQSKAYGKTLAQWHELYFRWAHGQVTFPFDKNGNAVVGSHVVLMPLPNAPGDGTPGTIDVTLQEGQPFVLPLWNVLGTTYTDGTPVDPPVPMSVFRTLQISLKIDGRTVVDSPNVMDYYVQYSYDPPIPLPAEWAPYKAIVWAQGIGLVHTPLSPGTHTFKLDVRNTQPVVDAMGNAWTYEYHNTWNINVVPAR